MDSNKTFIYEMKEIQKSKFDDTTVSTASMSDIDSDININPCHFSYEYFKTSLLAYLKTFGDIIE